MNQAETPSSYNLRKAREIILVAFHFFGTRLSPQWYSRPVHDLYLFLRRSRHFPGYVKTDDLIFLEIFARGNKYATLLELDSEGCLSRDEAARVVPTISISEAIECATEMAGMGYELLQETVKRLLRTQVGDLAMFEGATNLELVVAAGVAYA